MRGYRIDRWIKEGDEWHKVSETTVIQEADEERAQEVFREIASKEAVEPNEKMLWTLVGPGFETEGSLAVSRIRSEHVVRWRIQKALEGEPIVYRILSVEPDV